ncbi:TetR/AcrR family transcriptional regulator [Protaetiibacter mangrovi]|uniref:TetR/AcrR family transcriptional regulator n=1 Tax=Protaetiibacter mangrovi TaxID=2970926 RepID=A0ABT1ZHI8_9MICO|nr:TetR/AcrR family transcriptional regulator [Protaetiibacter mangrovi]MCS0500179.1 TetR/AcrR family transcriptional regulator [Protaetiibacter mangrovi]TPX02757.1 TetR/AcrR family transcriptional regulator [Schumannella luteola]
MPKVSDAHRASRRDQIVDAAVRCFSEKGFHRTSMADIIDASGLSAGAIYLQFESKQDIVAAAAQRIIGHRVSDIRDRLAAPPLPQPDEFIQITMDGLASEVRDSRMLVQLWSESFFADDMTRIVDQVFGLMRATVADYLSRWAAEHRALAPAAATAWGEETAPALLGLLQGHILQSALLHDFDPAAYRRAVHNLFV